MLIVCLRLFSCPLKEMQWILGRGAVIFAEISGGASQPAGYAVRKPRIFTHYGEKGKGKIVPCTPKSFRNFFK
jgi:hypothetical protein